MKSIFIILTALLLTRLAALRAAENVPPIVGAIRWDAWYGESGPVKHTEASLGPPKYHYRLPWFARVVGEGKVSINGDSQAILEQEIAYAAAAGLNYWAFVDYWDDANLSIALRRYRAAKDKQGVRYCFVEEGGRLDAIGTRGWTRLIEHFKDPNYQTVLDGRPLLFLFVKSKRLGRTEWRELGDAAVSAGLARPYLVLMGWQPESDAKDMAAIGFDAVSAYARGGSYSMEQPTYAEQCALIRRDRWEKCREHRIPSVTFASAGWDTRPRNERPPPWITGIVAKPDHTPPSRQKPLMDAVTATPDELAAHIREALEWTQRNRDINPSNAIIIYGWNENDEGGWLIPTLGSDGRPNEERIKALGKVLRGSSSLAPTPQSSPPSPPKAQRYGSSLYDPAEPYNVNLPVYPVTYSEEQKRAQRESGVALVKAVNEAIRGKKPDYTATPGIYRLPKGVNFETRDFDRFALHLPDCELILEPVPDRHLFAFGRGKSFTLSGPLKVDYDPLPESQGRIVAADFATKKITVEVLPGYDALAQNTDGKRSDGRNADGKEQFYTYSSNGVWLPNPSWSQFEWKDATLRGAGRTLTVSVGKDLARDHWDLLYKPGNLISIGMAGCGVLFCIWPDQLGELNVQDLDFYGGAFGWGNATGDSTLMRVRGMRRPGTNRLQGGGGWQSQKREGRVTLDSCEFRTAYDDILDLSSGSMDMVWQKEGPRQLIIWSNSAHHYELDKAGDAFAFYGSDFTPVSNAKLVSTERIPDDQAKDWVKPAAELVRTKLGFKDHTSARVFWRLTFDKDLSLEPGTLVEDIANRQMEVIMRNCTWYDGGVRVMIQSGRKVEVTNNTFVRIASGLQVCTDGWWWQGETVNNVLIANNLFIDCSYGSLWGSGKAAVSVFTGGPKQPISEFPGSYPNNNIVIRDNRIEGSSSGGILVQNSDRVQITGNECRKLFQRKTPTAAISVSGCANVTIKGNRVQDCPAPAVMAEWVDGLKCSSNAASRLGKADKPVPLLDLRHVRKATVQHNTADKSQLDALIRALDCEGLKQDCNKAGDSPATPIVKEEKRSP